MSRVVIAGAVAALSLQLASIGNGAEPADKPNVLVISIDDLNDWVGCLGGHPDTHTPNIDRLAARGMLFTNAHCQGTMCNPSRISLLWGRRPSSTGFYDNHYHVSKEPEFLNSHVSLPAHFAANGYKTLTAGKVFHGGTNIREHFQVVGPRPGQWLKGLDQKIHDKPKGWHGTWDFGPQDYDETKFTDHVTARCIIDHQIGRVVENIKQIAEPGSTLLISQMSDMVSTQSASENRLRRRRPTAGLAGQRC